MFHVSLVAGFPDPETEASMGRRGAQLQGLRPVITRDQRQCPAAVTRPGLQRDVSTWKMLLRALDLSPCRHPSPQWCSWDLRMHRPHVNCS